MAIMKNELWNIREWLDHYSGEGIRDFFLIDNGSSDDTVELANSWLGEGTVQVVSRPDTTSNENTIGAPSGSWTLITTFCTIIIFIVTIILQYFFSIVR